MLDFDLPSNNSHHRARHTCGKRSGNDGSQTQRNNFIPTPAEAWFTLFSAGTMPLSNIGLGVKVASSIFLVFVVLAALRIVAGGGPEKG